MTGDSKGSSSVQTKEELNDLFEEVSSKEKSVMSNIFAQPVVPLGLLGFGTACYFMAKAFGKSGGGESLGLSGALQKRVVVQFGTVAVMIGGLVYYQQTHRVEQEALRHERDLMQKQAWQNYAGARHEEEHPDHK